MATVPAPPTAATVTVAPLLAVGTSNANLVSTIKTDWTWFTQHLLLLIVLAAMLGGAVYGVDSLVARHDASTQSKYESILATQAAQTNVLIAQLKADEDASAQRDAAYQATIASLSKSIVARNAASKVQQTTDANLDISAAANRLQAQTNAQPGEITIVGPDANIDLPVTRTIVANLDALATAQGDLVDTQNSLDAQTGLTNDANKKLTDAESIIASQTTQAATATKVCDAQIKTLTANNRKRTIKTFFVGFGVGFVAGATAHIW